MTGRICDGTVPDSIDDAEKIVRAIKTPYHYDRKKARLKPAAFIPAPGKSDVSVVRMMLGNGIAAEQARQVSRPEEYCGLAVVAVSDVRALGTTVYDHKHDFCGHAHINHGISSPLKGETFQPETKLVLDEKCREIVAKSQFFNDSGASPIGWPK